ncbi:adenylosuccinate lyase [Candidatus Tachikawaea gelatinosa]|uniref:Adenylosuccinate lyase n=1 Tax=Candidatus Tachikawaea gelatinosa TaxID=1410383 RepID=A0A090BWM4_9ENTR|nr:adenylosuccinate lyase [Candidatus Tachikawaea gelatinosa]BAP58861.1 adenylosuccinate lyase [Candidatus Tachikawaea gelatinosa]
MQLFSIKAISPIDGRYNQQVIDLKDIFSEYGFFKFRIEIEIKWLKKLASTKKIQELPSFDKDSNIFLENLILNFNESDALYIKEIEKKTNHDIKAVEYFLKEKIIQNKQLKSIAEFLHFSCTSEDINNLAYALMLKKARTEIIIPCCKDLINLAKNLAYKYKKIPLLSRTHGQPATSTTMGKEIANFVYRMQNQLNIFEKIPIKGKINGAVGNYNAHFFAYPEINWINLSKEFVTDLGITWNPYTTQIEPHDYIAEFLDCLVRFNNILIDFTRDLWSYISRNYFHQKTQLYEIGSSTMPHKINPIFFENSEGNLGLSNAIMIFLSNKLLKSRLQRDLTDSTVLRNLGVCISYSIIAYKSFKKGIQKLEINTTQLLKELNENWAILAEPIQTLMRRYGIKNSYEKLKTLTYGKHINKKEIKNFVETLKIPEESKKKLKNLTPMNYLGCAIKLVENL